RTVGHPLARIARHERTRYHARRRSQYHWPAGQGYHGGRAHSDPPARRRLEKIKQARWHGRFATYWSPTARRMDKARILVVEDESLLAEDIQERLKSLGYEACAVAHTGEEALAGAALAQPDLV